MCAGTPEVRSNPPPAPPHLGSTLPPMPAVTKYTAEQMLAVAARIVADDGLQALTMKEVGRRLGAPSGSVYHRFPARGDLLAQLWIATAEAFQAEFIAALDRPGDGIEVAVAAGVGVVDWVRTHPNEAAVLLRHHRDELLGHQHDAELASRASALVEALDRAIARTASRVQLREEVVLMATIDIPYGAVRRYVAAGAAVPADIERHVGAAIAEALRS